MSETPAGQSCPVCDANTPTDADMVTHLRDTHPAADWGQWSTRPRANGGVGMDGQLTIGTGRRIAYGLAIWPYQDAPRAVIRAMLPEKGRKSHTASRHATRVTQGAFSAGTNRTSEQFGERLRKYELSGMVQRGQYYVRILDRGALWRIATDGVTDERVEFLAISKAVRPAQEAVTRANAEAAKRAALRDLQAVYDLMKNDAGVWHGGKSSVRHVPHGWRGRPS